jgi:orotate phosphoribosyltransferase
MNLSKKDLGLLLYNRAYIKGEFKLRSGIISNEYFDKYRIMSDPFLMDQIGYQMSVMFQNWSQYIAFLSMGAIPFAGSLLKYLPYKTGLYIRKRRKEYGTQRIIEGDYDNLKNCSVVIVEDVITTGGAVIQAAKALRDEGAIIYTVLCIVNRTNLADGKQSCRWNNANLNLYGLYDMEELKVYRRV